MVVGYLYEEVDELRRERIGTWRLGLVVDGERAGE